MSAIATDQLQGVLARLEGVRQTGDAQWQAKCPAHNDRKPSLSVGAGDDGRVLLHCQSGCKFKSIVAAMGIAPRDLFAGNGKLSGNKKVNAGGKKGPKLHDSEQSVRDALLWSVQQKHPDAAITATYTYCAADGAVAFKVLRFDWANDKDVRSCRPASGGWIARGLPSGRPLYRVNELGDVGRVFVVEGEACADEARSLDLPCVTSAGGSKAASKSDWSPLARFDEVVILPDCDRPGERYAGDVARILSGLDVTVRILRLPDLGDGEDLVDFAREHRDSKSAEEIAAEISTLADAAETWTPQEPDIDEADDTPEATANSPVDTDIGNSERFLRQHGDDVLWCPALGWLTWDEKRWRRDESARVLRLAKQTPDQSCKKP